MDAWIGKISNFYIGVCQYDQSCQSETIVKIRWKVCVRSVSEMGPRILYMPFCVVDWGFNKIQCSDHDSNCSLWLVSTVASQKQWNRHRFTEAWHVHLAASLCAVWCNARVESLMKQRESPFHPKLLHFDALIPFLVLHAAFESPVSILSLICCRVLGGNRRLVPNCPLSRHFPLWSDSHGR